ncbi:MAG: hypothetical protein LUG86_09300 [Oscillospiraceae bacterium]|nr:hypothetical protein [Oscillospiraceae bacterium]
MKVKINRESVAHYILIYLLIISQGSVIFGMYQNYFLILLFLISGMFLITHRRLLQSGFMCFLYVLAFDLLAVVFLTSGGLSIFSVGNIISRFVFAYVVYEYNKDMFVHRFVCAVSFFAVISLITYALQMISYSFITSILPAHAYNTTTFYGGLLSTVVGWHSTRNIGLATEPGRYQIYLIAALFLLLFKHNQMHVTAKQSNILATILIVTTISAQSTTGYLALIVVLVGYVLDRQNSIADEEETTSRRNIILIITIVVIALVVFMGVTGTDNFIYRNFINKLFDDSGSVDLYEGSGGARTVSILTDLKIAFEHPLGMGYDPYQSIWMSNKVGYSTDTSSCVGLTSSCAALGFPAVFLILGFYIRFAWKNKGSIISFITLLLILINTSLAQPLLYFSPMIVMFLVENRNEEVDILEA